MTVGHHSISQPPNTQRVMVLISKYIWMTHTIGNSHVEYPATSSIEVSYKLLRYYVSQCVCSRTVDWISYEIHHQWLTHVDSPTCTATQIDGNASISNRYWPLQGSCRLYMMMMHMYLSSFFSSENTLNSNHFFIIKSIITNVLSFFY